MLRNKQYLMKREILTFLNPLFLVYFPFKKGSLLLAHQSWELVGMIVQMKGHNPL